MKSVTFYLTILVIKLKGYKREFSKNPIDYKKLRKEDIHTPKRNLLKSNTIIQFKISNTIITEIESKISNNYLIIYLHGGAFICGPAKHHWSSLSKIVTKTNCKAWMVDYPKAPENKINEITQNIDAVYDEALQKYASDKIILMGDSVGGTLATSLIQRLNSKNRPLPIKLIIISPIMDASLSNPIIDEFDKIDPMLSKKGVLSAKEMCIGETSLNDVMISPINGSFNNFPDTLFFVAENDLSFPDQKITIEKMLKEKIKMELFYGKKMPHIWPLLPVMHESKTELNKIIDRIGKTTHN